MKVYRVFQDNMLILSIAFYLLLFSFHFCYFTLGLLLFYI